MKPTMYATITYHPWRSHNQTDRPSGYMVVNATPAEDPNQTIDPPKPTAYARKPQS